MATGNVMTQMVLVLVTAARSEASIDPIFCLIEVACKTFGID
ncbi:MAG: hypothetical protein ACC707_03135 [Thiohalomonadales bacterium]